MKFNMEEKFYKDHPTIPKEIIHFYKNDEGVVYGYYVFRYGSTEDYYKAEGLLGKFREVGRKTGKILAQNYKRELPNLSKYEEE